jgi:membrane protease YdiL (CAAX protease family)
LLHPVLVLSLMALFAWAAGATNTANANWSKAAQDFVLTGLLTIPVTLLTEDGFFRGWLWSSLKRAGLHNVGIALVTGIAFGLWHLPYAILDAGYTMSSATLPLYIINASIIGIAWGLLRMMSGSAVVVAVVHGVWNGAAYAFFNNGTEIGALGIQNTALFGPEAGLVGLALSIVYAVGLWMWYRRANSISANHLDRQTKTGLQSQDVV